MSDKTAKAEFLTPTAVIMRINAYAISKIGSAAVRSKE